ncbi:Uncharacterised protein [Yersinia rohdei]|uniref:hypothetical protein n=1 Tax=Yersinia rohdei TaxID=29485 RepID=UPI0005E700FD|nr:Uncharacterised protein [Yersinia rohdei]
MFLFDDIIHPMVVDQRHEPFNEKYLQRIEGVLCNALQDHPQTTVIRVDYTYRKPEMWVTALSVMLT